MLQPVLFHSCPKELYWRESIKYHGKDSISPAQVKQKRSTPKSAVFDAFGVSELSFARLEAENHLLSSESLPRHFRALVVSHSCFLTLFLMSACSLKSWESILSQEHYKCQQSGCMHFPGVFHMLKPLFVFQGFEIAQLFIFLQF